MPLILLPAVTFQAGLLPYGPTMEGQYNHQEPDDHICCPGYWWDGPRKRRGRPSKPMKLTVAFGARSVSASR